MMKKLVLLIWISLLGARAFAATAALRDLNPKDDEYLKKHLPALFGASIDLPVLDEAIRLLMARGTYENVFAERRADGGFNLIGKPVRTIEKIEFRGTDRIDESDLRELLDFKLGDRFDRKRVVASAEKIKNYYGEHGFFNAVVEVSFEKEPSQNIKVVFAMQEKTPCVIRRLEFVTANTDLKAKLESRFKSMKARPLTTERGRRLTNGLSRFLIEERYLNAEVSGPDATYNDDKTEAYLKFEIRQPYRWEFYMDGYKFLNLTDVYEALDLRNSERKNVDPANEGAERLRRSYIEQGFPSIQINTKIVNPPGTYLKRVYYAIKEGPRARLKAIEVQGRVSRPSRYYQNFIVDNSSKLIARGFYNRTDLETGIKNLVTDLRNQGFLRARALSSRIEFSPARDQVTVHLLLEEGPQTQIRALDFDGNKFFSSFELAQVTGLETNSPLHLNTFENSIEKLKTFYHNQGFLEMKLLNENEDVVQYNEKGTQARILFRIYEGPRIRVNSIAVEGNALTKSGVILKEADFRIGEVLTPSKIEDATARLNKLGLFSRAEIHTLEEGTSVAERTLIISVTERDPGVISIGAGVTNERNFTVRGFTGFSYSNLWGTARAVSIRGEIKENVAQINYPEHEITAGYLEPFIFNTRTRGRVNVTRSEYVFKYDPTYKETDLTTTNRIDFLAERDLTLHTKLTWKVWSLESNKDRERYGRCIPDDPNAAFNPNSKCSPNVQQVAAIGPTLDIDYRDSAFLPTRGSRFLLVSDYADPRLGSSTGIQFTRTEANFTHYQRLASPRWVWANSIRGGYEANLSSETDSGIPSNYAFLLGGISTVRGFDLASDNERIPRQGNDGFTVSRGNQKLIRTDSHYYLLKSELRFPIYQEHGGVLFYDGGEVAVSGYHFHRPYRDAVGVGYRYNTPVGPLALDFAFKIRPEKGEAPFRFHLSIGTF
jgi:outer membrane protein assembly complex protein YaeT